MGKSTRATAVVGLLACSVVPCASAAGVVSWSRGLVTTTITGDGDLQAFFGTSVAAGSTLDFTAGAALSADGRRLLLRTYVFGYLVELGDGGMEAAPDVSTRALPVAPETQGEAIAWDADGRGILTVGEGERPALNLLRCRD